MKILVPYVNLHPTLNFVLSTECYDDEVICRYTGNSEESYFNLMREAWLAQKTFILIEHDLVPWPGALTQIWQCEAPFCTYPAPHGIGPDRKYTYGLGILKFDEMLMKWFPDHLEDPSLTRKWYHLDGEVFTRLQEKNIKIHYHYPPVLHLANHRFGPERIKEER